MVCMYKYFPYFDPSKSWVTVYSLESVNNLDHSKQLGSPKQIMFIRKSWKWHKQLFTTLKQKTSVMLPQTLTPKPSKAVFLLRYAMAR